jgi:Skp family chaperone for outer membrane proteins
MSSSVADREDGMKTAGAGRALLSLLPALTAVAVVAVTCIAAFGSRAVQGEGPAGGSTAMPAAAPYSNVAFVDLGRVMNANHQLKREIATLGMEFDIKLQEKRQSLQKEMDTVRLKLSQGTPGTKEYRENDLRRLDITLDGLEAKRKLDDLFEEKGTPLSKKHYRLAMEALKAVCAEGGYTVALNLFGTELDEGEDAAVSLKRKTQVDSVVWFADESRNITPKVITKLKTMLPPERAESADPAKTGTDGAKTGSEAPKTGTEPGKTGSEPTKTGA